MSLFITFEGGDGSGKTTQAKALYRRIRRRKLPVICTEEPGGTFLGRMLRKWLTDPRTGLCVLPPEGFQLFLTEPPMGDHLLPDVVLHTTAPRAELLAFTLCRAQLVDEIICPNLESGKIVICDRYADSTVAYQGYGRGIDLELIQEVNKIATRGLKPNATILLDLPPEEGLPRKYGTDKDRLEKLDLAFHQRVREGYLKMAASDPERWLVVDASQSRRRIAQIIWQRVSQLLEGTTK